ncbi:MAG: 3,4-dihydroxy-2-butanone-4-phosphate synthase [Armatimonadetes bacterium]|nr:3,4-dihydroxy-2-butanone-4-phosphate synthase [Armatimonadota bacterium]
MDRENAERLQRAIEAMRNGRFVALLDRPEREGEADLLLAAEHATGERINEMITIARGLLTVAMEAARLAELNIPLLEPHNAGPNAPRFAAPVDYIHDTTTGVSAFDRAATLRALADPAARSEDFAQPGHVFPLAAMPGGLEEREGHTEGAVALAKLAGVRPVVAMCEIMAPDGTMARGEALRRWLEEYSIPDITVAEIKVGLPQQRQTD